MTEKEERRKEAEKEGWIFIGEIEFKYNPFNKYRDDEPVFMYVKFISYKEGVYYRYGFGRGITTPHLMTVFDLEKRYSITTVLQWFISHDQVCTGSTGKYELLAMKQGARLAGMTEWILPNEDFLNKKVEVENLEKIWRTDKENKIIAQYLVNEYASDENKAEILKKGRYRT